MIVSTITDFLIDKFKSNPLTNTISFKRTDSIDHNKANIYPLVNLDLLSSTYLNGVHFLNYEITIYQQRDSKPEMNLENKLLNTNQIDNYNETYTIAAKFMNQVLSYHNSDNIDIDSSTPIAFLAYDSTNGLDGVRFSIVLTMDDNIGC